MVEKWKSVKGYLGLYEVSNRGRVRSIDRVVIRRGKPMKLRGKYLRIQYRKEDGIPTVGLCKEGRPRTRKVSHLVLRAFVGKRPSKEHQACHFDGNEKNNTPKNLRWGTSQENNEDNIRLGALARGTKNGQAVLDDDMVRWIRKNYRKGSHKWGAGALAKKLGCHCGTIRFVTRGQTWRHVL